MLRIIKHLIRKAGFHHVAGFHHHQAIRQQVLSADIPEFLRQTSIDARDLGCLVGNLGDFQELEFHIKELLDSTIDEVPDVAGLRTLLVKLLMPMLGTPPGLMFPRPLISSA